MTSKTQSMKSCTEKLEASHGKVNLHESLNRREEDDVDRRPQTDVDGLLCSAEESKVGVNE